MFLRFLMLLVAVPVCLFSNMAKADWINLTGAETAPNIAEIYVMDDHVRLVLEAYVGNLDTFEDLIPDDWMKDQNIKRPVESTRLRYFSENVFQIVTNDGNKLQAKLELLEPRERVDRKSPFAGMINPYTRQRVPEPPADKRVLYAELIYPFTGKPSALTFIPPQDEEGRALTSIGFIAYHKSVPIIDFRYLGAAAKVNLD